MHKTYSMAINLKFKKKKNHQCAKCYIFLDFSICVLVFNVKRDLWFFVIKKKKITIHNSFLEPKVHIRHSAAAFSTCAVIFIFEGTAKFISPEKQDS